MLGVQGASGGVGASVLTAGLAVRAAAAGLDVGLVDACPWGGGLDLLVGLDPEPGARWPDLATMRAPRGEALLAELPRTGGDAAGSLAVLSWTPAPPVAVPKPWSVIPALGSCRDVVLIDLPPPGCESWQEWLDSCDDVVLLVGAGLDTLRAARGMVEGRGDFVGTVVRTAAVGVDPDWIQAWLGLPVLAELGEDRSVAADLLRGRPVGSKGQVARVAERLLADLMPAATAGTDGPITGSAD
ncbi:hypothetical protein GCM10009583_06250 [Ornithinicoccus hortensis]|uniref:Secretion/DNA translocation related CpaE-like protein n=1 Tax=Ornithinicoccus hortensis TaxID=82346 RepID=A0A542YW42_9MICO|nr:secretion/DNA translocation related CpaE-like protein [Ornithinicoccus hortensis]